MFWVGSKSSQSVGNEKEDVGIENVKNNVGGNVSDGTSLENSDSSSSSDGISSVNEGIVVSSRVYITLVKIHTYFCTYFFLLYMEQNYSHHKLLLLYVLKCFIFFFTFF